MLIQVIVPIHLSVHWTLAVINMRDKSLYFLDSMFGNDRGCLKQLVCPLNPLPQNKYLSANRLYASWSSCGFPVDEVWVQARYIVDEVADKSARTLDVSSWKYSSPKDIPAQENGCVLLHEPCIVTVWI